MIRGQLAGWPLAHTNKKRGRDSLNDSNPSNEQTDQIVIDWVEHHVGPVTRIERQGRWRPAWYVDVSTNGRQIRLYVRGDRGGEVQTQPQPLSFEYRVFKLFEDSGLRIPHIYGYIDELPAIVMERVPGIPDLKAAASDEDRAAVTSQFVDQMILMHRVDPALMEQAGAPRPTGKEIALAYYRRVEPLYLATKNRPEPAIEFLRRWINRNTPTAPDIAYPIAVDAGQFIFDGNRLTAMLDFEFAALGDYHTDLATLRLRNRMEYIGDIDDIYRQYAARGGLPVDPDRIRYHTVIKGVLPPMQMAGNLGKPISRMDYYQYSIWNAVWLRIAFESIAEMKGWQAEVFSPPQHRAESRSDVVLEAMEISFETAQTSDEMALYQRNKNLRTMKYLRRLDAWQLVLEGRYLADVEQVTGHKPRNWREADTLLEAHVLAAPPEEDERLVRLFWRQLLGQCFLLANPEEPAVYQLLTSPLQPLGGLQA